MSIYASTQIQAALQDGRIVCVPFRQTQLSGYGLQLTLGNYYYRAEQGGQSIVYNPSDPEDTERYFEGAFRALPHAEQAALSGLKPLAGIAAGQPVILLAPGERIVGHTHEFVGANQSCAVEWQELSVWRQSGVAVSIGAAEPAIVGRPSLVIQNLNQRRAIMLPVGVPIIRAVFSEAPSPQNGQPAEPLSGVQTDRVISLWTPSSILASTLGTTETPAEIQGLNYA